MRIKIIDFGLKNPPKRAHANDAGADVFAEETYLIKKGRTVKIPLGFGLKIPDGFAGFIYPRSSLSAKGVVCELPPIDSGYRGEIHAIVSNLSDNDYTINEGDRIGQLVIMPIIIADFSKDSYPDRGTGAFGSSGR